MSRVVRFRATSGTSFRHKGYADKLGAGLHQQKRQTASCSGVYDGFVFKARKHGGRVVVDAVEVPGRFEGSNQYRDVLDPLEGESSINGIVASTSPMRDAMAPASAQVGDISAVEHAATLGRIKAFGAAMPADPFLLYNSFATEFDGGVIFVHLYTDAEPPGDGAGSYIVTDQPVWLAVLVRWAGAGAPRSVSFSEDHIRALTGKGFYPRHVLYQGAPVLPIRYGARLPVAHYHDGRLSVAMELQDAAGAVSTIGGILALGVMYRAGSALVEWQHVVDAADLGAELESDSFDGDAGPFRAAGFDLPAVFSWTDAASLEPAHAVLVSFRARCRKAVAGSYRLATAQALLTVVDGVASLSVDMVDAIAGLDAGLPIQETDRVLLQKYRDDFFLDSQGMPVRHRRMRVMARPALDNAISASAPTSLPIHADMARLVTDRVGGQVVQSQAQLGYGPEELAAGQSAANGGNGIENIGFSTPVALGEVWSWGFINGMNAQLVGIARITAAGVAAPLASLPRSLRLSTYQREVVNDDGETIVPMGQVATVLDAGLPKIAIKKGRVGALAFAAAASFSRFGTFYLASPASIPRYGRMFE